MKRGIAILAAGALTFACRAAEDPAPPAAGAEEPVSVVPVRTAKVAAAALETVVAAPGHTMALVQQKVRAPFAGTVVTLRVADGDRVEAGDVLGSIVSRDSEAAMAGAREMEREAKTPAEKEDASRAIQLAQRNVIQAPIRAPSGGVVLSHGAAAGDRVAEDQEILTIADRGSIVFVADVAQNDLGKIRPAERASVEFAGGQRPVRGVVHGVLPTANPADFTAPVRVDLPSAGAPLSVGLFGRASIVVAEKPAAVVVPDAAILRDDVSGQTRIALVTEGRVHWEPVVVGLHGAAGTEIVSPALRVGDDVVVEGLVGLSEGARVTARP